jgi:hypothetical protein
MAYSVRFGYCTMEYTVPIHEGLIAGSELMLTIRLIKGTQLMVLANRVCLPKRVVFPGQYVGLASLK